MAEVLNLSKQLSQRTVKTVGLDFLSVITTITKNLELFLGDILKQIK